MSLLGRLVLAVTRWGWVRRLFTSSIGRRLALRFVAGEHLDDAVAAARRLQDAGFTVSLDHLGEHVADPDLAVRARDDYLACLDRIEAEGLDANISIKLTQLGLGLDDDLAADGLDRIAARAADVGRTVTIDMEESRHTERTIELYEAAQAVHGNLGLALQAYLRRTTADLARVAPLGGHLRLCKGAYDEDADVAFQRRSRVDAAFDRLLRDLMAWPGVRPAIATHDGERIDLAVELSEGREAPYEFQMLYGVREPLQRALVADGHPVRIYVPYGTAWYPYLTRRIAERPANLWFFLRALVGRRSGPTMPR
ncbi:MAG: proline dehydrogenase family protein [Acidimicrobiia bacterium]|nr:proline dehydrogenase family protein [Acidimicrobiia bacterium]